MTISNKYRTKPLFLRDPPIISYSIRDNDPEGVRVSGVREIRPTEGRKTEGRLKKEGVGGGSLTAAEILLPSCKGGNHYKRNILFLFYILQWIIPITNFIQNLKGRIIITKKIFQITKIIIYRIKLCHLPPQQKGG